MSNHALKVTLRNEDDGGICEATVTANTTCPLYPFATAGGCFFRGAEGPGTFRVDVSAEGYQPTFEEGIVVKLVSEACPNYSVRTEERTYVLQRAPDAGM